MKLSIHFLLLLCTSVAVSQSAYKDGYIITLDKDTIYGEIDFREGRRNYNFCRFRTESGVEEFRPNQIHGYGLDDIFFQSGIVDNSFVEVSILGRLSVFKHHNQFYLKKTDFEVIKVEKESSVKPGKNSAPPSERWKGALMYWLSDCDTRDTKINLHQREIIKLAKDYNKCTGEEYTEYKKDRPWTKFDVGVVLGINNYHMRVHRWDNDYLNNNYRFVKPVYGVQFTVSSPRLTNRFAFQMEYNTSSSRLSSLVINETDQETKFNTASIYIRNISMPFNIRYTILSESVPLYLHMGMSYNKNYNEVKITSEVLNNGIVTTQEIKPNYTYVRAVIAPTYGISTKKEFKKIVVGMSLATDVSIIANDMFFSQLNKISLRTYVSLP